MEVLECSLADASPSRPSPLQRQTQTGVTERLVHVWEVVRFRWSWRLSLCWNRVTGTRVQPFFTTFCPTVMAEELPKRFDPLEKSEMRTLPTSPVRRRRAASVNALSPTRFELLDCSLADSSSSRPSPCEGDVSVRSPKIDQHSEVLPQVRQPSLPRGVRSLSFTIVFVLGFGCALLAGYLQPDGVTRPLREQALGARAALTKAFDEVLNSDTSEKLMNATWTLRQLVDMHSTSVTGRLVNATRGFSGIMDIVSTWNVPSMRQVLGRSERVGVRMQRQGLELKHPVVMIPGIITTGQAGLLLFLRALCAGCCVLCLWGGRNWRTCDLPSIEMLVSNTTATTSRATALFACRRLDSV